MKKRLAFVGAGALGGYVGGSFAQLGLDVTLIDPWPEHVEKIRVQGLELDGLSPEEQFTVRNAKTLHLTEETIAGIVGWGRTVGVVASLISVDLFEAGRVRRTIARGGDRHTVFRVGEPHGRITGRVEELVAWFARIDSAKATTNLWGERWSKLVQNAMSNGVSAATGLTSGECSRDERIRRFQVRLAGEGVRVGQALGYQMEKIRGLDAARFALASEGDAAALKDVDAAMLPGPGANPRAGIQRPSMAQDIRKGRRTEIEAMNGFIAAKGAAAGVPAPANEKLTAIVTRVERGEVTPSPALLAD